MSFADLSDALGPQRPLYGLQPRGVDGVLVPHSSVAAAARSYAKAVQKVCPQGPVHLLGHSFGGWIALEMAHRLKADGCVVASLTLVDTQPPDQESFSQKEYTRTEAMMRMIAVLEMAAQGSLGIRPGDLDGLDNKEQLSLLHSRLLRTGLVTKFSTPEVLLGPLRTFECAARASYCPQASYLDPVHLVLLRDTKADNQTNWRKFSDNIDQWRHWAPTLISWVGPGNHITGLKTPHVSVLVEWLRSVLS